ncbi:Uncharacterized conserved protein [Stigmatella aurantiaca]|uniref:Uncharacterized conserved protein n=1 Tax=Stigmatella aurantiaca TaxID=41 RepID=A0A1H7QF54_STIAU|nr:YciI family protein [Stigmatella aurantiaca]SEL46284.1 Uncharacterized conserved protein [Stigmatella aurantiaca]
MRFIAMHKTEPRWEAGAIPGEELISRVGKLMGEFMKAGILLGGEGLRASAQGVRLRFSGGKRTVTKGPFTPSNELPAGFLIVRTASLDEASAWASRYASIVGDVEIDIRPVTEPWDIGMVPMPQELAARRYMLLYKADAASESGRPRPAEQRAKLSALFEEMSGAKVLLTNIGLRPSQHGKRYTFQGERYSVVDGPFAESKELIAGYAMFQAKSLEEASEWALRYGTAVAALEVDLRAVEEP